MSKIYIIILLFLAGPTLLFAQHTSMTTEDFNGDGIDDHIQCSYDIGNSSGGSSCEITDGKTQKTFKLSNYSSFSSIKKWVAVAAELQEKENEYFGQVLLEGRGPVAYYIASIDVGITAHLDIPGFQDHGFHAPVQIKISDPFRRLFPGQDLALFHAG